MDIEIYIIEISRCNYKQIIGKHNESLYNIMENDLPIICDISLTINVLVISNFGNSKSPLFNSFVRVKKNRSM